MVNVTRILDGEMEFQHMSFVGLVKHCLVILFITSRSYARSA